MKKILLLSGIIFLLNLGRIAQAEKPAFPQFNLHSEDGSLSESCEAKPRPGGGPDWIVKCGKKEGQEFAVHLFVNRYPTPTGSFRYQIFYWVLDYNYRPDPRLAGSYHGTNLSFELERNHKPVTYRFGQIVQTTWVLEVKVEIQ